MNLVKRPYFARIDREVFHRHPANPILTAAAFPSRMRAVYNSAAVKVSEGKYVMLCRVNQLNHKTLLWPADSTDGIHFTPRAEPYALPADPLWEAVSRSVYYDPRITFIDGEYKILVACEGDHGCRVALFRSSNLEEIEFVNYVNVPDNRNMVIFPEKAADGRYMRLERPNTASGGGKGDIWLSFSPDLIHWGDAHKIIKTSDLWNYAYSGLGPSTVPLRTSEGWLIIFHAIMNNCTTREYSVGAALLDLEKPWVVRHMTKHPILFPEADYEMRGLVEHVCFPCAKILENDGTVRLYYGGADTVQCVAEARLDDIIHACKHW
ncbi:MAG: glycoside hydrolase family 130 protein [Opitutaceae bacterium]|nr:glycoside hydrolase family 130 protein [Opitutaceae bacterium]